MTLFERIVVPVDGSALGDRILTQVRRLLLEPRARVFLVRVLPAKGVSNLADEPLAHLARLRESLEREGVRVETRLLTGEPAGAVLDLAQDVEASLVALSTHGRTGVERWVRGSVAERLLRSSPFPLLLGNPFTPGDAGEGGFRRILVPLDGSATSSRILPLVGDLARACDAQVVLAHVLEIPDALLEREPLALAAADAQEPRRAEAERLLAGLARTLPGVSPRLEVLWGDPAAGILDLAERERADLLAFTTHGRSGTSRWLYGSVAEHILHHVRSPILVLRTGGPAPLAQ